LITGTFTPDANSARPEHHGRDVPGDDPAGVGEGLAPAEVGVLGVHDDRLTAQLGDPGLEREAGAQAGLVEEDRDRARAGQRGEPEPVRLHLGGQVQNVVLLLRGQVVVAEEVAGGHRIPSRAAIRASA
jgi:hypothetical protein